MSDATVLEVMEALAAQLEQQLRPTIDDLQVMPLLVENATPPCLDVFPGDPFDEQLTFDNGENGAGHEQLFTVRARVSGADNFGGQQLLLGLMDRGAGSVRAAILADATLGGAVDEALVEGPSGFLPYADASGANVGSLLGCEWRLRVTL